MAATTNRGSEGQGAARKRVLVVDDNVDITTSMRIVLEAFGQDVRVANDGPNALKIAAEYRPDLVFLDLGLPAMNGFDVARSLREQAGGQLLVIVALSGWGDAKMRARSAEAGFDQHWLKPIDPEQLQQFLTTVTPKR